MAMHIDFINSSTGIRLPLIGHRAAARVGNPNHPNRTLPLLRPRKTNSRSSYPFIRSIRFAADSFANAPTFKYGDITSSLENVEVFDLTSKAVPIVDLWRNRQSVVAFARHFGCVLCRKRADVLAAKKDLMDAAGVALVLIAPGTVDQAISFFEQTKFKGEVYADPSHLSYDALNFAYGVSTTFTPKAGMKIIESYLEGYRQDWGLSFKENTRTKGGWQQGGILVAGPGINNISYLHKDKEAGDDPSIEDVLKACCSKTSF